MGVRVRVGYFGTVQYGSLGLGDGLVVGNHGGRIGWGRE